MFRACHELILASVEGPLTLTLSIVGVEASRGTRGAPTESLSPLGEDWGEGFPTEPYRRIRTAPY